MALYHFKQFFILKLLHFWFSHWNTGSIVLRHLTVQKHWDIIVLPLIAKYWVVIKDSGTEPSPIFDPGTPQYFFSALAWPRLSWQLKSDSNATHYPPLPTTQHPTPGTFFKGSRVTIKPLVLLNFFLQLIHISQIFCQRKYKNDC